MSGTDLDLTSLITETPVSVPYWAALRAGRLDFQRCRACGNAWLPPREECPRCLEADWAWETASGHGRVISWVVYHVAPNQMFASRVPYNVAIVELDEGPRLITNLLGDDGRSPRIEAPVQLEIQEEGGLAMARFRLV
ncbi:MAG TPA: OB-fold domain-containing protein [Candidatus Dormibacteraeota bacterium]|nr:OB-fold domain-containing protein [Candidatus Dormibacteraeota bacterium]